MKRVDNDTATVDNQFTEGNPGTGTPATILPAQWLNVLQEEIAFVIETAGITLDQTGADTEQLYDALNALFGGAAPSSTPPGVIADFGGTSAPAGWLLCYGQAVSRATYSDLFTAIGTTHGAGDGSTTFNLPDLRGRVSAGKDDMGGSSASRLTGLSGGVSGTSMGASGGSEAHTLTENELASHYHLPKGAGVGFYQKGGTTDGSDGYGPTGTQYYASNTDPAGGGAGHNNVQPTIILNKIIKI